jgi:hypothetical protein
MAGLLKSGLGEPFALSRLLCASSLRTLALGRDWRLLVPRLGGNQDTGDVAAGRAFIRDQSRIALDRGDPQHLLHRGLAARAR